MAPTFFDSLLRNSRYIAYFVNVVICGLIVWSVWSSYEFFSMFEQQTSAAETQLPPPRSQNTPVDLALITKANLFGVSEPSSNAPPGDVEMQFVPETALDLELKGVFSIGQSGASQAIIRLSDGAAKTYAVGDDIAPDVVVHQISARYIVIRRSGAYETLWLPRDKPTSRDQQIIAVSVAPISAADFKQAVDSKIAITPELRQFIAEARRAIFVKKQPVSRYIRLQAITEKGVLRGYRVYPGRDPTLFEALPFEKGDLVLSINGMDFSSTTAANGEVLSQLSDGETLSFVVKRGGVNRVFEFDLSS
ncbi:general secretion pathway protein C [Salinisphaera sp. T5B8]|uniref:type II secretion system protein N n=1 Tax=Salinisphaera sp. T5B8 TaxID=1304154 RepID=UPI00333FEAC6